MATWHAPLAHYLESWGDGRAPDGSYVSVQPMILPLFGGWSELDVLAKFAGLPKPTGPELVQETFKQVAKPADFVTAWAKFLHDGFLAESAAETRGADVRRRRGRQAAGREHRPAAASDADTYEVVLVG